MGRPTPVGRSHSQAKTELHYLVTVYSFCDSIKRMSNTTSSQASGFLVFIGNMIIQIKWNSRNLY
jgi:hypothetical protein